LIPRIELIPIKVEIDVCAGEDLCELIMRTIKGIGECIKDGDILVIAHKIVSKSENKFVNLKNIEPSEESKKLAKISYKDPRLIELIRRESNAIVRHSGGIIIVETKLGFICANAGIDQSNVSVERDFALLLPENPDKSAALLRSYIRNKCGKEIAVIISDTFGRPFREGQTNVAIGLAGIEPIESYIGKSDIFGKKLKVTEIAVADEIASAAELAMGKTSRIPAVILRGYPFTKSNTSSALSLIRNKKMDLFRDWDEKS
jgi:coenzyme F420-0:L-glutamate ligase / coenzyme F420-1:gamma-L-glutamate ligase